MCAAPRVAHGEQPERAPPQRPGGRPRQPHDGPLHTGDRYGTTLDPSHVRATTPDSFRGRVKGVRWFYHLHRCQRVRLRPLAASHYPHKSPSSLRRFFLTPLPCLPSLPPLPLSCRLPPDDPSAQPPFGVSPVSSSDHLPSLGLVAPVCAGHLHPAPSPRAPSTRQPRTSPHTQQTSAEASQSRSYSEPKLFRAEASQS